MSEMNKKNVLKKIASVVVKTVKVISITLLSLVLLIGITVGTVLYIVFTPEKTTKIVNHYANELLNADVNFNNIDITFLSTYPDFYLTINDGNIVSKAFKQEGRPFPEAKDSLLSFAACRIKLNPIKYLQTKDIDIDDMTIEFEDSFPKEVKAPVKQGDVLGKAQLLSDGRVVQECDIISMADISALEPIPSKENVFIRIISMITEFLK